jgi:hypothetical protein
MNRWAPWWAYLVPIIVLNYVRQALIAPDDDAVSVALFAALTVTVFIAVTAIHRASDRDQRTPLR